MSPAERSPADTDWGYGSVLRQSGALGRAFVSIAGTHHDASNALTGALLSASVLHRRMVALSVGPPGAGVTREVERLQDQLRTLKEILGSAGRLALEDAAASAKARTPATVASSLDESCQWLSQAHVQRVVERDVDAAGPAVWVKGGPLSLARIFHNLLLNASQGDGARGANRVVVTSRCVGGRTHVTVSDNGPGFAPGQLEGPIQPFHTRKPTGSGLGLANVELAVREAGGQLKLANGNGGGAVVSFDLETASP